MLRETLDNEALRQIAALEEEYFIIVDEGIPTQRRVLREGKTLEDFNVHHADIWRTHEDSLIANGYIDASQPAPPIRDLAAEIDALKTELKNKGIIA